MELKHSDGVGVVALSRDGRTAATSVFVGNVRVWDLETREHFELPVACAARMTFSAYDVQLTVFCLGGRAHEFNLGTKRCTRVFEWRGEEIVAPVGSTHHWLRHSKRLAETVQSLIYEPGDIICAKAIHRGRFLMTGTMEGIARVWDVRTRRQIHILRGHTKSVERVIFARDARTVLTSSSDHTVRMWDFRTGECLQVFEGHQRIITGWSFSRDFNTMLTGSFDHTARVWDCTAEWKVGVWSVLSTPKWDPEMARELSHFF